MVSSIREIRLFTLCWCAIGFLLLGSKISLLGCELLGCSSPPHVTFWCRHRFNWRIEPDATSAEGRSDNRVTIESAAGPPREAGNGFGVAEHHLGLGKQFPRLCAGRTSLIWGLVGPWERGEQPRQWTAIPLLLCLRS